jgi:hypothetical protein
MVGCLYYYPCAGRHYLAGVHRQLQEPPHSCRADETEEEGVPLSLK